MFYRQASNQYINEGTQFIIDGVTYPSNWLNQATHEQKQALGLVEVIATNSPFDPKYYWTGETLDGASLTYTGTAKPLTDVKEQAISDLNQTAYSILLPSDYMAGKAFETGTAMDATWATWRQAIRAKASEMVGLINICASVDEVAFVMANIVWPADPNQETI
jgi:hypothetical protein